MHGLSPDFCFIRSCAAVYTPSSLASDGIQMVNHLTPILAQKSPRLLLVVAG